MAPKITPGVPTLINRVHKKSGYHIDDIRNILNAATTEIRLMMEEGKTRRIQFAQLGSFDLKRTVPKGGYNFQTKKKVHIPSRFLPKFVFNRTMVATIKKIKTDNG